MTQYLDYGVPAAWPEGYHGASLNGTTEWGSRGARKRTGGRVVGPDGTTGH